MGRAIDMEKDIDILKKEVTQLKTAFNGLSATVDTLKVTSPSRENIDLHEATDERNVKAEGTKTKKKSKTHKVVEAAEA